MRWDLSLRAQEIQSGKGIEGKIPTVQTRILWYFWLDNFLSASCGSKLNLVSRLKQHSRLQIVQVVKLEIATRDR